MADVGMARGSRRASQRQKLAGTVACLVAGAGLSVVPVGGASAAPDPGMSIGPMPAAAAVPLAQAGEITMWGPLADPLHPHDSGQTTVPASLSGVAVTQVAVTSAVTLALTAAGHVVAWGANGARLERVPEAVSTAQVAQIATSTESYAGAVTRDGRVLTWGRKYSTATPLDVPAGLSGVKQLAMTYTNAVALKADGSVVAWGQNEAVNAPPPGLTATAIAASTGAVVYALTTDGKVTGWGEATSGELTLPTEVRQAGNVKSVVAFNGGGAALLADNTVVMWGPLASKNQAWLAGLHAVSITALGSYLGVVDPDGVPHERDILN